MIPISQHQLVLQLKMDQFHKDGVGTAHGTKTPQLMIATIALVMMDKMEMKPHANQKLMLASMVNGPLTGMLLNSGTSLTMVVMTRDTALDQVSNGGKLRPMMMETSPQMTALDSGMELKMKPSADTITAREMETQLMERNSLTAMLELQDMLTTGTGLMRMVTLMLDNAQDLLMKVLKYGMTPAKEPTHGMVPTTGKTSTPMMLTTGLTTLVMISGTHTNALKIQKLQAAQVTGPAMKAMMPQTKTLLTNANKPTTSPGDLIELLYPPLIFI